MHPILFKLGPITIYSYGLMVALGFIIGTMLAAKTAVRFSIPQEKITTLSLVLLISGIIGARIFYIALNIQDFKSNPIEMVMITHGGLIFYGGAIAAFLSGMAYIKISKLPIFDTLDLVAPYIALGHSLGRIGCFLNGCCFGKHGMPTQIYSSVCLLLLYIFLRFCLQYRKFKGQIFFLYLVLYTSGRFFMEFLRGDNPLFIFNLTFSQVISAIVFIIGVALYFIKKQKSNE